jgi:hypothetical protein
MVLAVEPEQIVAGVVVRLPREQAEVENKKGINHERNNNTFNYRNHQALAG